MKLSPLAFLAVMALAAVDVVSAKAFVPKHVTVHKAPIAPMNKVSIHHARRFLDGENADAQDGDAQDADGQDADGQDADAQDGDAQDGNAQNGQYNNQGGQQQGDADADAEEDLEGYQNIEGMRPLAAGQIAFVGCHSFVVNVDGEENGNQNQNEGEGEQQNNWQAQQYGEQGQQNRAIASYVVLSEQLNQYDWYAGQGQQNTYSVSSVTEKRRAMALGDYINMATSARDYEMQETCNVCTQVRSYCIPLEEWYMYTPGSTIVKDLNNQNGVYAEWEGSWDWSATAQQNMGNYYGVEGALDCVQCLIDGCFIEFADDFEYMAKDVYNLEYDEFLENVSDMIVNSEDYEVEEDFDLDEHIQYVAEYSEELADEMEAFGTCSQLNNGNYYAGWSCTRSGTGIQRTVFSDADCYIPADVDYYTVASANEIEQFETLVTLTQLPEFVQDGVSCDNTVPTVIGNQIDYATNTYAYTHPDLNSICQAFSYNQIEGEINLDQCKYYGNGYANQQQQGQQQGQQQQGEGEEGQQVNQYYNQMQRNYELDVEDVEDGNLQDFCYLIDNTEFGYAAGNQQVREGTVTYDHTEASGFSALSKGVQGFIWFLVAAAGLALIIAGVVLAKSLSSKKNSDLTEELAPQGEYVAA